MSNENGACCSWEFVASGTMNPNKKIFWDDFERTSESRDEKNEDTKFTLSNTTDDSLEYDDVHQTTTNTTTVEQEEKVFWSSASILPFMRHPETKEPYFVLGRDRSHVEDVSWRPSSPFEHETESWSDFGGSRKSVDVAPIATAARELYEESIGIFSPPTIAFHPEQQQQAESKEKIWINRNLWGTHASKDLLHLIQSLRLSSCCVSTEMPTLRRPSSFQFSSRRKHLTYVVHMCWNPDVEQEFARRREAFQTLLSCSSETKQAKHRLLDYYASYRSGVLFDRGVTRVGRHLFQVVCPPLVGETYGNWCLLEARPSSRSTFHCLTFGHISQTGPTHWTIGGHESTQNAKVFRSEQNEGIPSTLVEHPPLYPAQWEQNTSNLAQRRRKQISQTLSALASSLRPAEGPASFEDRAQWLIESGVGKGIFVGGWRLCIVEEIVCLQCILIDTYYAPAIVGNYYSSWNAMMQCVSENIHLLQHSGLSLRTTLLSCHLTDIYVKQDYLEKQAIKLWSLNDLVRALPENLVPAEFSHLIDGTGTLRVNENTRTIHHQHLRQCFIPTILALLYTQKTPIDKPQ